MGAYKEAFEAVCFASVEMDRNSGVLGAAGDEKAPL
jgi:hypothetical protein